MTENIQDAGETDTVSIAELREHARIFAAHAPGPLRSLRMRSGDTLIEVEWHQGTAAPGPAPGGAAPGGAAPAEPDDERIIVKAPLVGTFYRAPAPGRPPFIEVGDLVAPNQAVGIIEAMKLMNSVTAGQHGRVAEILVEDGAPVEFGEPLIALLPAEADVDNPGGS
jgi:acetyl-CoA carboxylase biotin carboxyl carrier protein